MVLASTRDGTPIEDLAQLADKIIEVATPPIVSTVTTPSADIEQLRSEIASLTKLVSSLQQQHARPCKVSWLSRLYCCTVLIVICRAVYQRSLI